MGYFFAVLREKYEQFSSILFLEDSHVHPTAKKIVLAEIGFKYFTRVILAQLCSRDSCKGSKRAAENKCYDFCLG